MEESQIIALKDIESSYKTKAQEQLYLKSINLKIQPREAVAIIGRSGAGKSALLRCIALLERPLTGIIAIDNKNLTFMASRELVRERRSIGLISTKAEFLNSKTVFGNVALPLQIQGVRKAEINRLVEQALIKVGLEHKVNAYPSKLNVLQKIQLDIARNIVNSPKILLFEDIFSCVPQSSSEFLVNLLQSFKKDLKLTLLITSNDAGVIKTLCDSVIVMQHGAIIERCSVQQLFTNPSSEVAKEFIRFNTKYELPLALRKKIINQEADRYHALARINFSDCLAPEEILSNTITAYDLKMNIIQAYQEKIQDKVINIMLIEIYGESKRVAEAIGFLNQSALQSEIIGYVPNIS